MLSLLKLTVCLGALVIVVAAVLQLRIQVARSSAPSPLSLWSPSKSGPSKSSPSNRIQRRSELSVIGSRCVTNPTPVRLLVSDGDRCEDTLVDDCHRALEGGADVVVNVLARGSAEIEVEFEKQWPRVAPGGLLTIQLPPRHTHTLEALAEARKLVAEVFDDWTEQLVLGGGCLHRTKTASWWNMRPVKHALPANTSFVVCERDACAIGKCMWPSGSVSAGYRPSAVRAASSGPVCKVIETFVTTATSLKPTTDKVTVHSYETMYGMFLVPFQRTQGNFRLFEIGLGCTMTYGAGASVTLWKQLFPRVDLWEAEYNSSCVEASRKKGQLEGIEVVSGDQGDPAVVDRWVRESGGSFDAVIDDGGHRNYQIKASFDGLWPHVAPGGLYFIEDISAARLYQGTYKEKIAVADIIQGWIAQLASAREDVLKLEHPLPRNVSFVFCQREACVIGKSM